MDPFTRAGQCQQSARRQTEFDARLRDEQHAADVMRPLLDEAARVIRLAALRRGFTDRDLRTTDIPGYGAFPLPPDGRLDVLHQLGIRLNGSDFRQRR